MRDDIIPRMYYYTFPKWSRGRELKVLVSTSICFLGGVGGAFLTYLKHPSAAYVWHTGIFAFFPFMTFYVKGLYQKYMDCAWDAYF